LAKPTYSIVISSRNEGDALRATLESILRHSPIEACELVVVDDASGDGSCDFLAMPAYEGVPVRLARNDERRGLIFSRARGADMACGRYLMFLDAHCAVISNWLEILAEQVRAIGGRGIVVPLIYRLTEDDWTIDYTRTPAGGCSLTTPFLDFGWTSAEEVEDRLCTCTIGGGAWMCRRDWYTHVGGLDRGMVHWGGENVDFPLRTWVAGGWCVVAEDVAVGHRFKPNPANPITGPTVVYNKIRAAHTVFTKETFDRIMTNLALLEGFKAGLRRLHEEREPLARLKGRVESLRQRSDRWLIDTFRLPVLEASFLHRKPRRQPPDEYVFSRPLVSIIVPVTDGADDLRPLLDSLLEKTTYGRYEVVLCTAGITPAFVEDYPYRPRVRVVNISGSPTRGLLVNMGACATDAEFLAVLDHRALILEDRWLEKLLMLFERRPRLLAASARVCSLTAANEPAPQGGDLFDLSWDWEAPDLLRERAGEPAAPTPYQAFALPGTLLFARRRPFLAIGGADRTLMDSRSIALDLSVNAWLSGHEVFCYPDVAIGRRNTAGGAPAGPPAGRATGYGRLVVALKYFTSPKRLARFRRERSPGLESLFQRHTAHIHQSRSDFLARAVFDESWLFYKFMIEETSHD
jgi:glycosyltransferase involved in cell wall biosynthesis